MNEDSPPTVTADVVASSAAETTPPRVYRGDALFHWTFLVLCTSVMVAACVLQVRGDGRVVIPVADVALPGTCSYKQLLGLECPGCGLTRCFISLTHGSFEQAWNYNPAGIYLFAVVLFQIPYRAYQLRRLRRGQYECQLGWIAGVALGLLIVALLAQWIVRVI